MRLGREMKWEEGMGYVEIWEGRTCMGRCECKRGNVYVYLLGREGGV